MKCVLFLGIVYSILIGSIYAKDSVSITFKEVGGSASYSGEAVLVNQEGLLATVAIVGVDPQSAHYLSKEGKEHKLELVAHDEVSRLTLLQSPKDIDLDLTQPKLVDKAAKRLAPADIVYLSTQPESTKQRFVSHDKRYDNQVLPLMLYRVNYKESLPKPGTPIYNTEKHLVALVHQAVKGQPMTSYALPIRALERLMLAGGNKAMAARSWVGIGMDPADDALVVASVRPGSPAKQAGLMKGDVVISIGGRALNDYAEVVDAFFYLVPNTTVKVKVLRGTELIETQLTPKISPTLEP